jgi:hypothetical protein
MKAFPNEHPISGTMNTFADGMDLRDYFAAKAMLGMIGREGRRFELSDVELAYQIADAMMKARNV